MALTTDIVSYYKLDETSGTNANDEINNNEGTTHGAAVNQTGKIDKAYSFDGNDYVDLGTGATLNLSSAFTLSFWIKPSSLGNSNEILSKSASSGTWDYECRVALAKPTVDLITTNGSYQVVGGDSLSTGTWYFFTARYDGSTLKVYINADEKDSVAATGAVQDTTNSYVSIARKGAYNGFYFSGLIDEVGIWSRALTSTEITALYNSGSGFAYPFTATGTNAQINIGDDWKEIDAMQINIGDTWKAVAGAQVNIGDSWKEIY